MAAPKLKILDQDEEVRLVKEDYDDHDTDTPHHAEPEEGESWLISYADMMTLLVGFFVVLQSFSKVDSSSFEKVKKETTQLFGGQYQVPFEKLSKELKEVVEKMNLSDQVLFHQTDQGVEITFKGALFFDSGSAVVKDGATQLLHSLIPIILDRAKDFGIIVEGHTDSTPISKGPYLTNWELSSVRACRIVQMFQEKGFAPEKMKALGWGETKPILPNLDDGGKPLALNQAQNRRVVIKIMKNFDEKW